MRSRRTSTPVVGRIVRHRRTGEPVIEAILVGHAARRIAIDVDLRALIVRGHKLRRILIEVTEHVALERIRPANQRAARRAAFIYEKLVVEGADRHEMPVAVDIESAVMRVLETGRRLALPRAL